MERALLVVAMVPPLGAVPMAVVTAAFFFFFAEPHWGERGCGEVRQPGLHWGQDSLVSQVRVVLSAGCTARGAE